MTESNEQRMKQSETTKFNSGTFFWLFAPLSYSWHLKKPVFSPLAKGNIFQDPLNLYQFLLFSHLCLFCCMRILFHVCAYEFCDCYNYFVKVNAPVFCC